MIKNTALSFIFTAGSVFFCLAADENVRINPFHPSPAGEYKDLLLYPTNNVTCDLFTDGYIYYDSSDNEVTICAGAAAKGFGSDCWKFDSGNNFIFPENTDLNVGIGTDAPNCRLQVIGAIHRHNAHVSHATQADLGCNETGNPANDCFVSGEYSAITCGGPGNVVSGSHSVVIGGENNNVSDNFSVIIGGRNNQNSGAYTTVIGGEDNIPSGDRSVACGKIMNEISGEMSVYMGEDIKDTCGPEGKNVVVGQGCSAGNNASWSIAMGTDCIVDASHAFALGHGAEVKTGDHGAFVCRCNKISGSYQSKGPHTFSVEAAGGIYCESNSVSDAAEYMFVSKKDKVKEGELVSVSGEDLLGRCQRAYDPKLIGVISSPETITLHLGSGLSSDENRENLPVALLGRCYVKVNNESGIIRRGDPVTSSSVPGIGMKAVHSGKIIGYSMQEEKFEDKNSKEILVYIKLGYYLSPEDIACLTP